MAVSFPGVQLKSKHLRENEKKFHFARISDLRLLFSEFFQRSKILIA